nr:uncharacterized protein LOC111419968 [Onthophagus taurus]
MSSSPCGGCGQKVGRNAGGMQCESCSVWFHSKCTDIPKGSVAALSIPGASWRCKVCRSPESRRRSSLFCPPPAAPPVPSLPAATLESVLDAVREIRSDLKTLNSRYADLVESVQFCSNKVSEFEGVIGRLHNQFKLVEKITAENVTLKREVVDLTSRVSELEQYSRRSNLEIQGIPQKNNEDLVKVLSSIGESLDVSISPSEVDAIHRVPQGPGRASNSDPKAIVLLAAAKLRRRSAPKDSGPGLSIDGISDKLFINEHLTQANKILFGRTKKMAREKKYKYVWIRDCKIFVRKGDDSRPILIRSTGDIDKL